MPRSWYVDCSSCGAVCDQYGDDLFARRGGDGWWYCTTCWSKWWVFEAPGTSDSPLVNRVCPKWCKASEKAVHHLFPATSSLPRICKAPQSPQDQSSDINGFKVDVGNVSDAVRIFFEYGFVVVRGALKPEAAREVRGICQKVNQMVRKRDPHGLGNRGRGRYSFHNVVGPGQCLHFGAYARHLVDNAAVLDVMDAIFAESERRRPKSSESDKITCGDADTVSPSKQEEPPYHIVGAGGDFCEGWCRELQPLHSDYGRARPLRGPPWLDPSQGPDFPVHDIACPPMISVNFAVQPLHQWNGATRLVPWSAMREYVDEFSTPAENVGGDGDVPPAIVKDTQSFQYHAADVEVPPLLAQELKRRPEWLASRIFPLDTGDALLRDVRVWHGGCPNLSRAPRYLPSIEIASRELVTFYDGRYSSPWPKRCLPRAFADAMSARAKSRCTAIVEESGQSNLEKYLDDFYWVKWEIGFPAKRNHFLPGATLGLGQGEAISARACLEQLTSIAPPSDALVDIRDVEKACGLVDEQFVWLRMYLESLARGDGTEAETQVCAELKARYTNVASAANALLRLLAGESDEAALLYGSGMCQDQQEVTTAEFPVAAVAAHLLSLVLRVGPVDDDMDGSNGRRVRRRIEGDS